LVNPARFIYRKFIPLHPPVPLSVSVSEWAGHGTRKRQTMTPFQWFENTSEPTTDDGILTGAGTGYLYPPGGLGTSNACFRGGVGGSGVGVRDMRWSRGGYMG
jgi:hypothetical protein